jgi:hypothetical protein
MVTLALVAGCGSVANSPDAAVQKDAPAGNPAVTIAPAMPKTKDDLVATVTGVTSYVVRWSKNGTPALDQVAETVTNDQTTKGELWKVEVLQPGTTTVLASAQVTILNSAPTMPVIAIPRAPIVNRGFPCVQTTPSTDDDGDMLTYAVTWTRNGAAFAGAATTTLPNDTIPAAAVGLGSVYRCTLTVSDGSAMATASSADGTVVGHVAYMIRDLPTPTLVKLDLDSMVAVDVGPLGVAYGFGDLAWNSADATMYMVDGRGAKSLYKLNLATGAATLVGAHNRIDMFALLYQPVLGKLMSSDTTSLGTIDAATGTVTDIATGKPRLEALVYDSRRNVTYGVNVGSMATIDVATGTFGATINTGATDDCGAVYDPLIDRIFVADYQGHLYQHDPNNLAAARTNPKNAMGNITGIAIAQP